MIIPRFWFCRWLGRLEINIGWNFVHFWKSHVIADKLDVHETNFSFSLFNGSWNNFSWYRFTHGWYPSSGSLDFGYRENCGSRQGSEVSESLGEICHKHRWIWGSWIPRMFTKVKRSRRFRRFRRFRTWKSKLAASFPHVTWICASHGEGLLDRKKDLWSETDGQVERPRCEHCDLVHTHVCHTSSGSSSWTRSFGGFKIRQESTFEVRNTIILHNWETDQSADGNRRIVHDWPEVAYVERIISTVTELFEFWIPKPTSFPARCFAWEASLQNQLKQGKTRLNGILKVGISKNWIELTGDPLEFEWKVSPRIHYIGTSGWDSKDDGRVTLNLSNFKEGSMTLYGELRKWRQL